MHLIYDVQDFMDAYQLHGRVPEDFILGSAIVRYDTKFSGPSTGSCVRLQVRDHSMYWELKGGDILAYFHVGEDDPWLMVNMTKGEVTILQPWPYQAITHTLPYCHKCGYPFDTHNDKGECVEHEEAFV